MNCFFDTSAFVKYFHNEDGTAEVTRIMHTPGNVTWILEWARLEFVSALYRKFRAGAVEESQIDRAFDAFMVEYAKINVEPLGGFVMAEAEKLLLKYAKTEGLRTLDALHLGAYSLLAGAGWVFVASDVQLCKVARREGFSVIMPGVDPIQ